MPFRADFHQVPIAFVVLGQQGQVVVPAMVVVLEPMVIVTGHIDLAADDGLDDGLLVRTEIRLVVGELEELLHAIHVAVVGDGQSRHPELPGPLKQLPDIGKTVKNRILRVDVKVYEGHKATKVWKNKARYRKNRGLAKKHPMDARRAQPGTKTCPGRQISAVGAPFSGFLCPGFGAAP